jgi:type VI secretion system protein VasG
VHITDDAVRAAVTLSTLSHRSPAAGQGGGFTRHRFRPPAHESRYRAGAADPHEGAAHRAGDGEAGAAGRYCAGQQRRGERLAAIEQEEIRLILALDTLETQYGQELQLTEALLACRRDISRQAEINDLQNALIAVQQGNPLLGLDVDVAPWRR